MLHWMIHLGWEWTPAQQIWLDSGFAPAGHINAFTYLRPAIIFTWSH